MGFNNTDRLSSINEIFVNMREDPESFLVILSHQGSHEVIATATCRRYLGPDEHSTPWMCSHVVEDGTEEWELKLLATHPFAQGKGAGAVVLKAVEQEIINRFAIKRKMASTHTPTRLKMVLCTVQELFPEFYRRKGYREDYIHQRGEGFNFSIMFMSKTLTTID
ncbi:hypothetical protein DOTSEDRAFT_75693 [Dothistroma septosporum NZE10]|uniref:N-acetyltransferase domain-containing protein n=1 Tax=Dothistroma septosporum (strain NZE10 / CBS 128990) TaxID=675120 RepID=M2YJK6_DOTSN|nr:hypothetical protein DOTSEDRAFT_75693 [Dothistroma septosporum NZE10]